ncbi:hypothetical protein LEP1GSC062_3793 [Leptospira alexanderi serovar Manhao 3 str. L 60]|uniref:Uncharacterized protein n=1 Tax=Leptospira alexanderi serovar Manhao 3 str. L 60 TaxID=1049759 RepID=V6HZ78_9LEPT|nr:hypothetical protein LEP1GSC062_3793 [Leptospira alexanderi serovar Manhao 3 str. L 60]
MIFESIRIENLFERELILKDIVTIGKISKKIYFEMIYTLYGSDIYL